MGSERITDALDLLTAGLYPFVEREMKTVYRDDWHEAARSSFRKDRGRSIGNGTVIRWDAHALLVVMWDQWNHVFRRTLTHVERSLISELREFRNRWAHQRRFDFDDTYRILDSIERLLKAVHASQAEQVARSKRDLLRHRFSEEARAAHRKLRLAKSRRQDLAIYFICCIAIDAVVLQSFGPTAWLFGLFVVFVFGYLGYQRVVSQPPVYFGPHECDGCSRIIYGDSCPYCEPRPPKPSKLPARGGIPQDDPVPDLTEVSTR